MANDLTSTDHDALDCIFNLGITDIQSISDRMGKDKAEIQACLDTLVQEGFVICLGQKALYRFHPDALVDYLILREMPQSDEKQCQKKRAGLIWKP